MFLAKFFKSKTFERIENTHPRTISNKSNDYVIEYSSDSFVIHKLTRENHLFFQSLTHNFSRLNLPQEIHVSANTVPFHQRQIHPLDGSNCIMMGRRALVHTLWLMRSSNRLTVEACSIMDSGVVKTMCSAVFRQTRSLSTDAKSIR